MTLQDLALQTWRAVGEPSDLIPGTYVNDQFVIDGTLAMPTTVQLIQLVNRAYIKLCGWKQPSGVILRFKELNSQTFLRVNRRDVTVYSITPDLLTMTVDFAATNDHVGMYITNAAKTVTRMITSYVANVVTFDRAWPAGTLAGSYTMFARHFPMRYGNEADIADLPAYVPIQFGRRLWTVQWVQNQTMGSSDVQFRPRSFRFKDVVQTQGLPSMWEYTNKGLEFDYPPLDGHAFKVEYYAEPLALAAWTDIPQLPSAWHELIWMIATWMRLKEDKNLDEVEAMERDINLAVATLVQENERSFDYSNARMYVLGDYV